MSLASEASRGVRASSPDVRRRARCGALRFWIHRYGPQDVIASVAAVAACVVLSHVTRHPAALGLGSAALESLAFYVVAFLRQRWPLARFGSGANRMTLLALLREYGPAELADLVARPAAMTLGIAYAPFPALGMLLGGAGADVLFYALAAACHRRHASRR